MGITASPMDDASSSSTCPADVVGSCMDMKSAVIALLFAFLCGALAVCLYLRYALGKARGERLAGKMDRTLHKILDELEYELGGGIWDQKIQRPWKRNAADS